MTNRLPEAVVGVGSDHDEQVMLHSIVEAAARLTGARYAVLGVIGEAGELVEFVSVGLNEREIAAIDRWSEGNGLLDLLVHDPRPLRLADIRALAESVGFPPGHPVMHGFLGMPVHVRAEVVGNLYLIGKRDGEQF